MAKLFNPITQNTDINGDVRPGQKLFTFEAGTTTLKTVFTDVGLTTPHTNPVIADSDGKFPEIYMDNTGHKLRFLDANDVQYAELDNIFGVIDPNTFAPSLATDVESFTAGVSQTLFTLTSGSYTPGTNSILVFVDGLHQLKGTDYNETSSTSITFITPLTGGEIVVIITSASVTTGSLDAQQVAYNEQSSGAVDTNARAKFQEIVSVKDFGAVGDGVTDDDAAFTLAEAASDRLFLPEGTYNLPTFTTTKKYWGPGLLKFGAASPIIGHTVDLLQYQSTESNSTTRTMQGKVEETISVKDFGAVGDGTTDDTTAIQNAIAASVERVLFFPAGNYVVTAAELIITSRIIIKGESKDKTLITFKGTPAKTVRTFQKWVAAFDTGVPPTIGDSIDAAVACGFIIQAAFVHFEDIHLFKDFDTTDTTNPPVDYGADYDIGILVQVVDFTMTNVIVDSLWNDSAVKYDVTQWNGSTDRSMLVNCKLQGFWGLNIRGPEGDPGANPPGTFDDLNANDKRGGGGMSDFTAIGCQFFGSDRNVPTVGFVRRNASSGGAFVGSGQVSTNTAKKLQGQRFFSSRFASYEPFMIFINYLNRTEFIGCHSEARPGGFNTDGVTPLVIPTDFNGVDTTTNASLTKFIGGEKSGEPFDADGTHIAIAYDDPNGVASSLDDYEEGGWTPTLEGTVVAGSHTYSARVGRYTRIGRTVWFRFRVAISVLDGAASGNAIITGLPFTSDATSGTNGSMSWGLVSNVNFPTGKTQMNGIVDVNSTQITIFAAEDNAGAANVLVTGFPAGSNVIGSGFYDVA